MGGLLLLLALCVVMALASFLAGALPLSLTLSQSQLRLISSIGVGILVGTSLIVIIPEGIEAIATTSTDSHSPSHSHTIRNSAYLDHAFPGRTAKLAARAAAIDAVVEPEKRGAFDSSSDDPFRLPFLRIGVPVNPLAPAIERRHTGLNDVEQRDEPADSDAPDKWGPLSLPFFRIGVPTVDKRQPLRRAEGDLPKPGDEKQHGTKDDTAPHGAPSLPTFYIGLALALGFILMFLIDRLPRHATEQFQAAPTTRHISLDDLASSAAPGEEESEGFLSSLTPTPKQSRSLATTTGLVIHAAADGIAMGASATTANMKLGLIIFAAIMIHKAPAAFGLTSVLLKQGLSKRAARGHLIVFSLAAPVGALTTYLIVSLLGGKDIEGESGQWWTGMLLLFSAGTFLYVAMHAMQEDSNSQSHEHHGTLNGYAENGGLSPRKQARPQMRDTLATVVGMLLPLLTQFGHHH